MRQSWSCICQPALVLQGHPITGTSSQQVPLVAKPSAQLVNPPLVHNTLCSIHTLTGRKSASMQPACQTVKSVLRPHQDVQVTAAPAWLPRQSLSCCHSFRPPCTVIYTCLSKQQIQVTFFSRFCLLHMCSMILQVCAWPQNTCLTTWLRRLHATSVLQLGLACCIHGPHHGL